MKKFLTQSLLEESHNHLCILITVPKYLAADKLTLAGCLVSYQIDAFRKSHEHQLSSPTLQSEYERLVVYWSHLCQHFLGKSMDKSIKQGASVAHDLKLLKDNLSEGLPYLLG